MASTELHSHRFSQQQPQHQEPQRLSGIYQYHNAPEVLPEHGLEYDDNIYPVSDKYPVTSMVDYPSSFHTQQFRDLNKPPRIIFGMKVRSFLLVALVFVLIVVGAVVGGTVGRNASHATSAQALANDQNSSSTTPTLPHSSSGVRTIAAASEPTTTSTTSSTTPLSTPTFLPLTTCPTANNTLFVSSLSNTSSTDNPKITTPIEDLTFTRYCDAQKPTSFTPLTSAFVYTFDDCIGLCAAYNVYTAVGGSTCQVAIYDVKASRPSNCVVGSQGQNPGVQSLGVGGGVAVALLKGVLTT